MKGTKREMPTFCVRFRPDKVDALITQFETADESKPITEENALEIGRRILGNQHCLDDLVNLYSWKNWSYAWTGNATKFVAQLTDRYAEVQEALGVARTAKNDRTAISVLAGLDGVSVPTASAFLTMMFPNRFTIIDIRVLRSLLDPAEATGFDRSSINNYLRYLEFCRNSFAEYADSLRGFDKALWQFNGGA